MTAAVVSAGPVSTGARSHHPVFAVLAVLLASYLVNVDGRVFSVGLADLQGGLSLGFDEGAWLSTAVTAPQILVAPAVAWLATVFGVRRIFTVPSIVFALVSLLIPFSRDYETLIVLHIVRGLLLGVFIPATLMIIVRNLPITWWLPALAIYALRPALTANVGVSLVGFYVQNFGWQWLYWQDIFICPLLCLLVHLGAPKEPANRPLLYRSDWGGMLLFGTGLMLIYVSLDQGNRLDWFESGTITALFAGGVVLLVAFAINEALVAEPWASAKVILSRNIGLMMIAAVLFTLGATSNVALVPNFLSGIGRLRPEQVGPLLLVYTALPAVLLTPLVILLLRRIDPRLALGAALAAFAAASLIGTGVTNEWRLDDFITVALLQSVGQATGLIAIIMIGVSNADPTRSTAFSAYIQVLRLGGVEFGVALMATWIRVREQMHSNLLGLHVTVGDPETSQRLAGLRGGFASHGIGTAPGRGLASLNGVVQREANVLAFIDAFWLTFWAAVLGLLVVMLMTAAPPGPLTPKRKEAR